MADTCDDRTYRLRRGEVWDKCLDALNGLRKSLCGIFQLATAEIAQKHQVPEGSVWLFGSGFLVDYNDKHYIATCGHVLDHKLDKISVYIKAHEPMLSLEEICGVGKAGESVHFRLLKHSDHADADKVDVGFVRVKESSVFTSRGMRFFPVQTPIVDAVTSTGEGVYFMLGFPAAGSKFSIVTRTPSGIYLPITTLGQLQTIGTVDTPLFEVSAIQGGSFKAPLEVRPADQVSGTLDTGGCSGGPVFKLTGETGLQGDWRGFSWAGIQSHQGPEPNRKLRFQKITRWASLVDYLEATDNAVAAAWTPNDYQPPNVPN